MKKRKPLPQAFKKGNKAAAGPHAPGSGRPPDWLKEKCRELVEKDKLVDFLSAVSRGDDIDQVINDNGECLKIPAKIKDRITAVEMLVDRGWGKPSQVHEVEIAFVVEITHKLVEVLNKTLPEMCPHCRKQLSLRDETIRELEKLSAVLT